MSKINGIYAATMSILNEDLSLNVAKTISHGEHLLKSGCHGVAIFGILSSTINFYFRKD